MGIFSTFLCLLCLCVIIMFTAITTAFNLHTNTILQPLRRPPMMMTTTTTTTTVAATRSSNTRRDFFVDVASATTTATIATAGVVTVAGLTAAAATPVPVCRAQEIEIAATDEHDPVVTSIVTFNLSIARGPSKPLRIEVYGDSSDEAQFFTSLAAGTVQASCPPEPEEISPEDNTVMGMIDENAELPFRCIDSESVPVSYKGSQLWRLVPDKRLDFGRVDSMFASRIPPTFPSASSSTAALSSKPNQTIRMAPSTKGAVSMKRNGGAFEFTITPSYNPALDSEKENLIVIGRVMMTTKEKEGNDDDDKSSDASSMDFVTMLNTKIPTRKDLSDRKGINVPPLGSTFARACNFSEPNTTCAQFKPIGRIVVTEVSVEEINNTKSAAEIIVVDATSLVADAATGMTVNN
jgi:hypothetical protein